MNIYKNLLQDFWSEVSYGRTKRKFYSGRIPREYKLKTLKEFSQYYHNEGNKRALKRAQFNGLKHTTRSIKLTAQSRCFVCGTTPECRHHIISLKNGGLNTKQNIVHLCNNCHAEIHPWLKA